MSRKVVACGFCVAIATVASLSVLAYRPASAQAPAGQVAEKAAKGAVAPPQVFEVRTKITDLEKSVIFDLKKKVSGNTNAFDVLREMLVLDFKTYAANCDAMPPFTGGAFITGIAGVRSTKDTVWAFYLDGAFSKDRGISDVVINENTVIEFRLIKLSDFPGDQ